MANTAAQELLAEAKCFACVQSNSNFVALLLALINRGIVAAGGTRMTAQQLMTAGSCFACIQDMTQGEAMTLAAMNALVAQIAAGGGGGTTPNLSQVLTQGNNAGAQDAVNFDQIAIGSVTPFSPSVKLTLKSGGGAQTGLLIESTDPAQYSTMDFLTPTGANGFQIGLYGAAAGNADTGFFYNNVGPIQLYPTGILMLELSGTVAHVIGDLQVDGKTTSTGGIDPPYLLLDRETRASVKERVLKEVPEKKRGGSALFHNQDTGMLELYVAESDHYYNLAGELLT